MNKNRIYGKLWSSYFRKGCMSKIFFDESLNNVSTKKQLDVHIISFDENAKEIKRDYIVSEFTGRGDAETVVKAFKSLHGELDYVHNLAQISMNGPNVNWNIADMLKQYRKEEDSSSPVLLELGICGLHVLHGACQICPIQN